MDPEIVERLNEQFREMFEILSEQNSMMAAQMKAMNDQNASSNKVTKAQKEQGEKTEENTKKQEAYAKAEAQRQAAVEQATNKINRALDFTAGAFMSLGSAVMDSTQSFQKYNGTIGMLGDAAASLGKEFGVLGHVIGGVIKASTMLLQYQLEQKDNLLKFSDDISKLGAVNAFSTAQILEMANKVGLTSKELDKVMKPIQNLGSAFKSIGQGAADSTKKFVEMTAITEEATRNEFRRLGYNDEQRIAAQAQYIEQMAATGVSLRGMEKSSTSLQKSSLDYVKNLTVLSEITGKTVEEQQKSQQMATANFEYQLYVQNTRRKIEETSDPQEKARLFKELEQAQVAVERIRALRGEEAALGFAQRLAGGPQTLGLAGQAIAGTKAEEDKILRAVKQGTFEGQAVAEAQTALRDKNTQLYNTERGLGQALMLSPEFRELNGGLAPLTETNRIMGMNAEKIAADAKQAQEDLKNGKGPVGTDPDQALRDAFVETERDLRTWFDSFTFGMGLAVPALVALAGTAGLAALALGKGGGILGRLGGVLGGAGAAGAGGAATAAGGAAAAREASKAATKQAAIDAARAAKAGPGAVTATAATGADAAASASKLGKLGTMAKGAGRVLGKLAAPLAAGMALYDAYQGFNADADASFGGKLKNAGKSALSGLTFGLLGSSPEEIAKEKASSAAAPEEKQKPTIPDSMSNSFNTSVAAFGKIVAAFGKIVTAFIKTVKTSNAATSEFTKTVKTFNSVMKPLTDLASAGSRVKGKNAGLLGGMVSENEEFDVVEYIENLKMSLNDTASASDRVREAEMKRHRFTEESMTQFRRSLEDLTKTIGGITGIDRTDDDSKNSSPGGGGGGGGGEGAGSSDNAKKAMEYFMQQGWTKEQSAGIVGNLQQESGKDLDPSSENEIGMYGIAQWDKTRRKQFEKAMGKSIYGSSLEDQLAFIQHELTEGKDAGAKKAGRKLKDADTASEAASTFEKYYERSGGHAMGKRIANAESLMSDDKAEGSSEKSKEDGGFSSINAQGKSAMVASEVAPKFQSLLDKMTSVGYKIRSLGGYSDRNVAGTGTKSAHSRGWAIDVNPGANPMGSKLITDMPDEVVEHARSLGLGWGGDWSSKKDAMHYSAQKNEGGYLKARKGGIFDGPDKGYPVELHGGEMVAPLKQDSVLMKLAKTPATAEEESKPMTPSSSILQKEIFEKVASMNSEMVDNMVRKLDDMVNAIIEGNDTREKILKNSQA